MLLWIQGKSTYIFFFSLRGWEKIAFVEVQDIFFVQHHPVKFVKTVS